MSSNSSDGQFPILNPNTPLVYLPPDVATQYDASRYVYMATLGALVWDILCSMHQDYRLLAKQRIVLPTVSYFISRIFALLFVGASAAFQVNVVDSCEGLVIAFTVAYVISLGSTSFLFFVRIRAVFGGSPIVVACFFVLWVMNAGAAVVVPLAVSGAHIADTRYCVNTELKSFAAATLIVSAVHDTAVFTAISWRLITTTKVAVVNPSMKQGFRTFFVGRGLPQISRGLLRSGQQYYLLTVGANIVAMVMLLTPSIPPIIRATVAVPNLALSNAMACRVYRDIKFGLVDDMAVIHSKPRSSIFRHNARLGGGGLSSNRTAESDTINLEPSAFGRYYSADFDIEITKTVEREDDGVSTHNKVPTSTESRPMV